MRYAHVIMVEWGEERRVDVNCLDWYSSLSGIILNNCKMLKKSNQC